jgi:hypothetical protein
MQKVVWKLVQTSTTFTRLCFTTRPLATEKHSKGACTHMWRMCCHYSLTVACCFFFQAALLHSRGIYGLAVLLALMLAVILFPRLHKSSRRYRPSTKLLSGESTPLLLMDFARVEAAGPSVDKVGLPQPRPQPQRGGAPPRPFTTTTTTQLTFP